MTAVSDGSNAGRTTVDFGPAPGLRSVTIQVAEPRITAVSVLRCWVAKLASVNHSEDEHMLEDIRVHAHAIQEGVGFSITALTSKKPIRGVFNVAYLWSS